jgi:hypothetical protein
VAEYGMDPVPANPYCVAVTLQWGAGGVAHTFRYCSWSSDVTNTAVGFTYLSEPKLTVETEAQHGGISDVPYVVKLPATRDPATTLCRPYAHAPVAVTVEEMDPFVPTREPFVLFKGRVSKATKNPGGQRGMARLEVAGWRSLLQYPLGMTCRRQCQWAFGDHNCCYPLPTVQQVGIVSIVNGTLLTASTLTSPRAHYWTNGTAEYDGLVLDITDGSSPSGLLMKQPPPPEWVGGAVLFTPGCDKELTSSNGCRAWNNEPRFGGFGIAIPTYNPLVGNPGEGTAV